MQSETACHIGMQGKLSCQVYYVIGNDVVEEEERVIPDTERDVESDLGSDTASDVVENNMQTVGRDITFAQGTSISQDTTTANEGTSNKKRSQGKKKMTMQDYVNFSTRLMNVAELCSKSRITLDLQHIFKGYATIGKQTEAKKIKTSRGVKDTYQDYFLEIMRSCD